MLSACGKEYHFKPIPIPPERMDCQEVTKEDRPSLVPTHKVNWQLMAKAKTREEALQLAEGEINKLQMSQFERDKIIAAYILDIEGKLFLCASDDKWLQDYTTKAGE